MVRADLKRSAARHARVVFILGMAQLMFAGSVVAQYAPSNGRFVMGPLTWTPTLTLRDAGIDSNVFNTAKDPQQDITGSFTPSVDSRLTLGVMQLATQGQADFLYFERYTNQRAINGRVAGRMQFPTTRIRPILSGSWARAKDRSGNEIDVRVPRTELGYAAGLGTRLTPGSSLDVTVGRQELRFDQGATFRDVDIATRLNRQSTTADLQFRAGLSPLTSFLVTVGGTRDDFVLANSRGSDNLRGTFGFEFAPDAIIRGRANVGYHRMQPRGADQSLAFDGWTTSVDLSYSLLGRTLFNGRISRDTSYSVLDNRSQYLSTVGGVEVTHNLVGPIDLDVRVAREKLDYAATATGFPARIDYADTLGGGVVVRISMQARLGFFYDDQQRRSSDGSQFGYRRQHLYTSITYGF